VFRRGEKRFAAIFADDLLAACQALLGAHGGGPSVQLPISIPIDAHGVVLLRPGGPLDAPRLPATLTVGRTAAGDGRFTIAIGRRDGGPLTIPGIHGAASPDDAVLTTLVADLTAKGVLLSAGPAPIAYDEDTACSYANALFLTLSRKLSQVRPEASTA